MKKIGILLGSILLCCIGCKKEDSSENIDEARDLFNRSAQTIIYFISQIKQASDSLTIDSLNLAFEKNLIDINFSYPPQTDMKLTEHENDSLFKLMSDLKSISEKKLVYFKEIQISDSLELINSEVNNSL